MNAPLIVAGSLATFAAGVHGIVGELRVMRELTPDTLPGSRLGGPRATRAMIHVTWHIATVAFLILAAGLLLAGAVLDGDSARGVGLFAAAATTAVAVVIVGMAAAAGRFPRSVLWHPAPALFTVTAALAWWGAL